MFVRISSLTLLCASLLAGCGSSGDTKELEERIAKLEQRLDRMDARRSGGKGKPQGNNQGQGAKGKGKGKGKGKPQRGSALTDVGKVNLTGNAKKVILVGSDMKAKVPGPVKPGTYTIQAFFDGDEPVKAGIATIESGKVTAIDCNADAQKCVSSVQ